MQGKIIDYYKVLGTTLEAVYSIERTTEFERNIFIKRAYESKKKTINNLKKLVDYRSFNAFKKIKKHNEDLRRIEEAYDAIKTEELRIPYNAKLLLQREQEKLEEELQQQEIAKREKNPAIQYIPKEIVFRERISYQERDPYEVLGISRGAVDLRKTNKEKDSFIQERYEHLIQKLYGKLQLKKGQEEIRQIENEISECEKAYKKVASPILREEYDTNRYDNSNTKIYNPKTAYDYLNISRKKLETLSIEEIDEEIKKRWMDLIEHYNQMKKDTINANDIRKIEKQKGIIEEAYNLIKSSAKRKQYEEVLQKRQQKHDKQVRSLNIRKKYNHIEEYDPSLIDNKRTAKAITLEDKAVIRKEEPDTEEFYLFGEKTDLKIRKTGKVMYRSYSTGINSIDEYEITRMVNGEIRRDIVYTNLEKIKLSINTRTGEIEDPYYYDCVVNELFSEESIEGAKCNAGYIGQVLRDKQGNYYTTLGQSKLSLEDREKLTAILILKQREQQIEDFR